jgi:uncharacterized protein (DUF2252 family)
MATISTPLTPSQRKALGLAARKQLARSAHADIHIHGTAKKHDPLALLRASEADRIPALVAVKHQRMSASPFGFYRGAVPIMAADLAARPNTGLITQLCGDAHIANLGAFATPDGNLTFDINDFDESIRGPFEFDVKRLTTSLILGGREAGIKMPARHKAAMHFLSRYRELMHDFAAMPILELARHQIKRIAKTKPMPSIFEQAQHSTPDKTLENLTLCKATTTSSKAKLRKQGEERIFRTDDETPHLLSRVIGKEAELVRESLGPYSRTLQPERRHFLAQYKIIDVGFKVVGTGSVGLRDYIVYLEGTHNTQSDPLFLQIKEEPASAYAPYLSDSARYSHNGHRVMDGQRAMQLTSDPFLGYTTIEGRDYLVRQLNDHKASLDLTTLTPESLLGYADLCGELFARGHARAGDPVAIAAYLGNNARFDDAILSFAHNYADQTERYWAIFKKSLKDTSSPKSKPPAKSKPKKKVRSPKR